jgi:hypothetical protein
VSWVSLIAKRLLATAAPFAKLWEIGISAARGCNGFVRVFSREALSIFSVLLRSALAEAVPTARSITSKTSILLILLQGLDFRIYPNLRLLLT